MNSAGPMHALMGARCGRFALVATAALALSSHAIAQATIDPVVGPAGYEHTFAVDVSADGSVVVGVLDAPREHYRPFRLSRGGAPENLGALPGALATSASAVSADGTTIVGYASGGQAGGRAFRWTRETGLEDIGPGAAVDVNADGSVVLVREYPSGGYLWTRKGSQPFGSPPDATFTPVAMARDASVIVGNADYDGSLNRAVLWRAETGFLPLESEPHGSLAEAISADGSVITGALYDGSNRMFRWTQIGGMQNLGVLDGTSYSSGVAVNAGGSLLLGFSLPDSEALVWTRSRGFALLATHLDAYAVDSSAWTRSQANAVSDDGSVIVGWGSFLASGTYGWVVRLDHCPADVNFDAAVTSQDLFDFLSAFLVEDPSADFNADAAVNTADFFDFLVAFFSSCN